MVGGASNVAVPPGLSNGLGMSVWADAGDFELPVGDVPKPNGKAALDVEPAPRLLACCIDNLRSRGGSYSDGDDADPLRLGLGGTSPSLGEDSLEGKRGVNECDRECT